MAQTIPKEQHHGVKLKYIYTNLKIYSIQEDKINSDQSKIIIMQRSKALLVHRERLSKPIQMEHTK